VSDSFGDTATAAVSIGVACVKDPPTAVDDSYATSEETPLVVVAPGVLGNDSDVDGDNLTITGSTPSLTGTLTLTGDGAFRYQPAADFCGQDHFTYTTSDGHRGVVTATVTLAVACVNDPPSLHPISGPSGSAPAGMALSLTATYTDPDVGDAHTAIWTWAEGATAPGLVEEAAGVVSGVYSYDRPGVYPVRLMVFDQAGAPSNEVAFAVVVTAANPLYLPFVYR
jgi:hypothetical protein